MPDIISLPPGYAAWLDDLKTRIHAAQPRAALAANRELVLPRNLEYMRAFAEAWPDAAIVQQAAA